MEELPWPRAVVDGAVVPLGTAALLLTDEGFGRGDGAFETVGVWGGRPYALDQHLERLSASLRLILLPAVDVPLLRGEIAMALEGVTGDAALRVYVTASGTRIVTCAEPPSRPDARHLVPYTAPWIQPRSVHAAAGAKTMSYLPNMVASRAAKAAGGDDALLVNLDGVVLEGPTFAVYWVRGDVVHVPSLDLGVIDSTSRRTVLAACEEAGLQVAEGSFTLDDVRTATEFLMSSAVRDVIALRRVGDQRFGQDTPVRDRLSAAVWAARRGGQER